uniref:Uncharacterized protein n=1 Tax=Ackermannviridae sp. ctQad106 TaxID=2826820 RepID=A0A8S5QNU7_9CAUD|nr:MAG TPA: hypothetical protein [Ackermannviridae sp. ctQad106]
MTEYYITVHKKAAPAATRNDLKSAKATRHGTINILTHTLGRVNWGGIFGGVLGALVAAAIWVPVAYAQRGYWAIGGEIFLIGLAAGLGAWIGGGGEP